MMVTISERFKFRPVKSRMSAFVDRFRIVVGYSVSIYKKPGLQNAQRL